jgi:hypothetical protein
LIVLLSRRQRLDRVLVFLLGLSLPSLDRVHAFECVAFVSHDGVFGKALDHGLRITPIVGSDIASDRYWKIDGHFGFSCFVQVQRASPALSCCLRSQLRRMEADGVVRRIVHHQVPPKVEYCLTKWGQALCPALDALLKWATLREKLSDAAD